ncbi:MAG: hypothetical protein K2K39_00140 [Clostridia bacterium]|nr:hypothetical protein [Clostridia bacterium]
MSGESTNDNFTISEVIGSLQFGRWDKKSVAFNALLVSIGVFLLLMGGILYPILYIDEILTLLQLIAILVTFAFMGFFCVIFSGICLMKIVKGKTLLRRCLEDGDLHRSRAKVIVTTESSYVGRGRSPAIITLRFKVNGKKYEKSNLKNISYAEKYYNIDILYSLTHDEVFLLKMN